MWKINVDKAWDKVEDVWDDIHRPLESNPVVGYCPKCGLELRTVMWYACSRNRCPVFAKVSF